MQDGVVVAEQYAWLVPVESLASWRTDGSGVIVKLQTKTHHLRWGEDIPKDVMSALCNGETAVLHDPDGKPYSIVVKDCYGQIREKCIVTREIQ